MHIDIEEESSAILIKRVDNGFVITRMEELDDGSYRKVEDVFEDGAFRTEIENSDSIDDEEVSLYNILWYVKEFFGCYWSKHSDVNLNIILDGVKDEDGADEEEAEDSSESLIKKIRSQEEWIKEIKREAKDIIENDSWVEFDINITDEALDNLKYISKETNKTLNEIVAYILRVYLKEEKGVDLDTKE